MTPPPTVLAGKYRLHEVIGRGGMGTVWRADHLGFGAPVAVKLIDPKVLTAAGALRRFQNEARAAATLRSPHVVQVLDYGVDEATGSPFIAMELLEGESLDRRLRKQRTLSAGDTARVITHVARALSRAHDSGVVHRDLKPANIFLVRNDDEEIAKVLDFGTARLALRDDAGHPDTGTQTGAVIGTPRYMSPEQISGGEVDHRTDLWALGVIAGECLTGVPLFQARDIGALVLQICTYPMPVPSQLAAAPVPVGLDDWFARATCRDPAGRFQTARALADDLQRVCLGGLSSSGALEATPGGGGGGGGGTLALPAATAELEPPTARVDPRTARPVWGTAAQNAVTGVMPPATAAPVGADGPPSALDPIVRPGTHGQAPRPRARSAGLWLALALVIGGAVALSLLARGRIPGLARIPADAPAGAPAEAAVAAPVPQAPSPSPRAGARSAALRDAAAPSSAAPTPTAVASPGHAGPPPDGDRPTSPGSSAAGSEPDRRAPVAATGSGGTTKRKRGRGRAARAVANDGGESGAAPESPATSRTRRTAPSSSSSKRGSPSPSPLGTVLDQRR